MSSDYAYLVEEGCGFKDWNEGKRTILDKTFDVLAYVGKREKFSYELKDKTTEVLDPEHKGLLAAILYRSILDLYVGDSKQVRESLVWFMCKPVEGTTGFTFWDICRYLSFDYRCIKRYVLGDYRNYLKTGRSPLYQRLKKRPIKLNS